jgi:hypothetical protein
MKVFLTLKDTLSCLSQAFEFYPAEASSLILTYPLLLQYIENIYYEIYQGYKNWDLG